MFITENDIVKSTMLGTLAPSICHGFSMRAGGASTLPHTRSMNLGFLRGDDDAVVAENLRLFAQKLGVDPCGFVMASQLHTVNVAQVSRKHIFGGKLDMSMFGCDGVDGFVTDTEGITLLVRVADCTPILLADPIARVISAVHSGWRGTLGGIGAVAVEKMVDMGARRERIIGAVGACIGVCCYEVGDDFVSQFGSSPLIKYITSDKDGRYHADLKRMNREVLLSAGLNDKNIDISPDCTCCENEKYFSHRYTRGLRGTMGAAICLTSTDE